MIRRPFVSVVVVAPAAMVAELRAMLDETERTVARSTVVERRDGPIAVVVAAARAAAPARGVVAIVESEDDADGQLASGVDEVLVHDPANPAHAPLARATLARAVRRAALRAGVRDDLAIEARTLAQVLEGLSRAVEGPLAAIALDVDGLRAGAFAGDDGIENIDLALDECGAAVEHVARVLRDAAVLASPPFAENAQPLELGALVDQVVRALGGGFALRAHLEVRADADLPSVVAPRRTLARAIAQVFVQSLDAVAADDGGALRRVRVSVQSTGDAVAITVEVRPGLDAAPASTPLTLTAEGRLAVTREAVRAFDGELLAERSADGGVRYVLLVPRTGPLSSARVVRREANAAVAPRVRPRVLVVDRDERVLRAAARALADHYDVASATCGEEALTIARDSRVDAAVIDARLPDMSGAVLAEELRRLDQSFGARVVFVDVGNERHSPEAREARADGAMVLTKPLRRAALLSALDELFSSPTRDGTTTSRILN